MHRHDPLLHDVLLEGAEPSFESASLNGLLTAARRSRRQKRLAYVASIMGFSAVLFIGSGYLRKANEKLNSSQPIAVTSVQQIPVTRTAAPVPKLTDEELFALFPDRQIALIGPPENQRLIFVDSAPPRRP